MQTRPNLNRSHLLVFALCWYCAAPTRSDTLRLALLVLFVGAGSRRELWQLRVRESGYEQSTTVLHCTALHCTVPDRRSRSEAAFGPASAASYEVPHSPPACCRAESSLRPAQLVLCSDDSPLHFTTGHTHRARPSQKQSRVFTQHRQRQAVILSDSRITAGLWSGVHSFRPHTQTTRASAKTYHTLSTILSGHQRSEHRNSNQPIRAGFAATLATHSAAASTRNLWCKLRDQSPNTNENITPSRH